MQIASIFMCAGAFSSVPEGFFHLARFGGTGPAEFFTAEHAEGARKTRKAGCLTANAGRAKRTEQG
jgi:hypothetical protein